MVERMNRAAEKKIFKEMTGPVEDINQNKSYMNKQLEVGHSFDANCREILIAGRESALYFFDGFCKDELMERLMQHLMGLQESTVTEDVKLMMQKNIPYIEVVACDDWEQIVSAALSGILVLLIDGVAQAFLLDERTYPARGVAEPEKDKTLRGAKDGFVETVVFNTAMIRRRLRSIELILEMSMLGENTKTNVVVCYMNDRVNKEHLRQINKKLQMVSVDALAMSQESLAECIYKGRWYNPFPKFRYTERPDTAVAQLLEGNIIILVDNSPYAMILPVCLIDILEEADDYYFPPVTGTYLRWSRILIALATYFLTPLFLLFTMYPQWLPQSFAFILLKDTVNIPLIWQFLILELCIDGLRLAAVNTPNMLSTPLSVLAALVLGEFSVNSGWFNSEVMLYMAFVAVANYTQSSYELGYAIKFMRMLNLILTAIFGIYGFIAALGIFLLALINNKTIFGESYLSPFFPLDLKMLSKRLVRPRKPYDKNMSKKI